MPGRRGTQGQRYWPLPPVAAAREWESFDGEPRGLGAQFKGLVIELRGRKWEYRFSRGDNPELAGIT